MNRSSAVRLAAVLLLAVPVVLAPQYLPPHLLTVLTVVFIAGLLAASVNLLAGLSGLVSMGHAGIALAAAYGIAWASVRDWTPLGQIALALVATLLVSLVYAAMTARTRGIVFLMITLALGVLLYGLALKASSVTGGQNGMTGIRRPDVIKAPGDFYLVAVLACTLGLVASRVVSRSPFGLMLQGIRESPNRMASLGYPVSRAKFMAIVLSGLMAGMAGILAVWQVEFISPQIGSFARSANAVVMVILGGTGTIIGPLVGAGVVVGIEQWLSSYIERWPTLLGLVLVLVVLFAPRGIVGTLADLARRRSPAMGGAGTPGGPPPSQAVAPGSGASTTTVGAPVSPDHSQKEAGP